MKLLNADTVKDARDKLGERCRETLLRTETVGLRDAAGRILAETIISHENIPPYRRSIVDGYAVMSKDLAAAGEMIPSILKTAGEVQLGIAACIVAYVLVRYVIFLASKVKEGG